MAQFHIRDFPDDLVEAVDEMARPAGKSREAWLRDLVITAAAGPIVKERYALHFYDNESIAKGIIKRLGSDVGGVNNTGGGNSI